MNGSSSNPGPLFDPSALPERIRSVRARIEAAALRVHHNPSEIRLIAVSKGQPAAAIQTAFSEGLREFGENYLEEALPKISLLPPDAVWHMIGHVQGRKARSAAENFPWVQSVDNAALARRLSRFAVGAGRTIRVLLECNLSGEATKYGWPASDPSAWENSLARMAGDSFAAGSLHRRADDDGAVFGRCGDGPARLPDIYYGCKPRPGKPCRARIGPSFRWACRTTSSRRWRKARRWCG